MNKRFKNILAILIGIVPVYGGMLWYRLTQSPSFTTSDMILYPLLIGGSSILIILALNRWFLNQSLKIFNPGKGNWWQDVLAGLILTAIMFLLVFIEHRTLANWLPRGAPPSDELFNLMRDLARSPGLLMLYFGPVLIIGIALFEEVTRVFLLNNLWAVAENRSWQVTVILIVSLLVGVVHLYQGWFGIVSIGIKSVVMCFYYYRFRRLFPLILSHYLYDGIQMAVFIASLQANPGT